MSVNNYNTPDDDFEYQIIAPISPDEEVDIGQVIDGPLPGMDLDEMQRETDEMIDIWIEMENYYGEDLPKIFRVGPAERAEAAVRAAASAKSDKSSAVERLERAAQAEQLEARNLEKSATVESPEDVVEAEKSMTEVTINGLTGEDLLCEIECILLRRLEEKVLRLAGDPVSCSPPADCDMDDIWDEIATVRDGLPVLSAISAKSALKKWENDLNLIAAPTSAGKTSVTVAQILEWLPDIKGKILFWSGETPKRNAWAKLIANLAGESMGDVFSAAKKNSLPQAIYDSRETLRALTHKLVVIDEPISALGLLSMAEAIAQSDEGLAAIVIDYIQEIDAVPEGHPSFDRLKRNRDLEIGWIARKLHQIAKNFEIPVLATAQFNRTIGSKTGYIPDLLQLRESGRLEQSAAIVVGLRNEVMSGAKCPDGQTNTAPALSGTYTTFDGVAELDKSASGAMLAVRAEHPEGWILEEAFVLKNRYQGGVGVVVPFAMNPASGRCEPLEQRLEASSDTAAKAAAGGYKVHEKKVTPNYSEMHIAAGGDDGDDDDDAWFRTRD